MTPHLAVAHRFVTTVIADFRRSRALVLSGAVAYNTLLSIVPLFAVLLIALSHLVEEERLLGTVASNLDLIPGQADAVTAQVASFLARRQVMGLVGILALRFFSSMAFTVLESAMAVIFYHRAPTRPRHVLVSALIPYAFIMLLGRRPPPRDHHQRCAGDGGTGLDRAGARPIGVFNEWDSLREVLVGEGIQEQMRGAISARMGHLVGELSIGALGESVQGQRAAQEVATEVPELLPGSGVEGHIGVQRESLPTRATTLLPVHHRGGGAQPPHGMAGARTGGDGLLDGGGGVTGQKRHLLGHRIGSARLLGQAVAATEQTHHSTVDVLQDPGDLLVGGSGQPVEHGGAPRAGRPKTPSSSSTSGPPCATAPPSRPRARRRTPSPRPAGPASSWVPAACCPWRRPMPTWPPWSGNSAARSSPSPG